MPRIVKSEFDKLVDEYSDFLVTDDSGSKTDVIRTGSISLDYCLGIGGIPRGRITEIYGPFSSAKTTLCLNISRSAINSGLDVLYVDAEHALDYNYVRAILGDFDTSKFKILQPEYAEQDFHFIRLAIESGKFGLIVLDSVGALISESEKDAEEGKSLVGKIPALLTVFCKQSVHNLKLNNTALIFINQVRDKIGGYVSGYNTPGGHALKHFASMKIALYKSTAIKKGDTEVGAYTTFSIKKNKLAPPFKADMFPVMYGKGIDYLLNLVEFGATMGVVERSGAFYKFEGQLIGQGLVKAKLFLLNNPEILNKIEQKIYGLLEKGESNGATGNDSGIADDETADEPLSED